jgi:ABC-type sugar transport system substrate-binding protein
MRVLICGCRTYTDDVLFDVIMIGLAARAKVLHEDLVIINGKAPGADTLADVKAGQLGVGTDPYPADWNRYGRAAGPIRNKQMLVEGQPDVVIAFLDRPEAESKGTRNMIEQSEKAGILVFVIERRIPVEEPEQLALKDI